MSAQTFLITVQNDDYHQGENYGADDVKAAIEGAECSPECETRAFRVLRIEVKDW